jgi:hypothetical protein
MMKIATNNMEVEVEWVVDAGGGVVVVVEVEVELVVGLGTCPAYSLYHCSITSRTSSATTGFSMIMPNSLFWCNDV